MDLRLLLAKGAGYDYFVGRHDSMRIVTWNLNYRARRRDIPRDVGEVIASLKPDLIVLTEYVSGLSEPRFLAQLKLAGMSQVRISEFTPSQNQILVASHMRLVDRRLRPPDIDVALPSNIVHVGVPDSDLEVVGLRIPYYSRMPRVRRQCWDWVEKVASASFNTDWRFQYGSRLLQGALWCRASQRWLMPAGALRRPSPEVVIGPSSVWANDLITLLYHHTLRYWLPSMLRKLTDFASPQVEAHCLITLP